MLGKKFLNKIGVAEMYKNARWIDDLFTIDSRKFLFSWYQFFTVKTKKLNLFINCSWLGMDVLKVDALAQQKNSKRHFLADISKSFQEVTQIGPESHHFFSFSNISTNMVARGIQSFGQNGPWLAGWLSNGQNFFLNFAQTWDKQMLKISSRYLDSCLI